MHRLYSLLLVFACLCLTLEAHADFLEVRRSATLKAKPERDAKTRTSLSVGARLALLKTDQTNGYYFAEAADGTKGWLYRTLARRFPGDAPAQPEPDDDEQPDEPSDSDDDAAGGPQIPKYQRSLYKHWTDADKDCQSTRDEVLIAESEVPVTFEDSKQCKVVKGRWVDPYGGEVFTDPKQLDVDHMVPLQNAHLSGAWAFGAEDREAYANDLDEPEHLIAVKASLNRQKGAKGPESWKPPNRDYWCQYASDWQAIKEHWELAMTVAEAAAVSEMLETCE